MKELRYGQAYQIVPSKQLLLAKIIHRIHNRPSGDLQVALYGANT